MVMTAFILADVITSYRADNPCKEEDLEYER